MEPTALVGPTLDFVPLCWEPLQIATTRALSRGLAPLIDPLHDASVTRRIAAIGGYDLGGAGEIIDVT